MILSLRIKNFYSVRDEAVLDFTADMSARALRHSLGANLIDFHKDKFVNIIGMFGSNAAGKSNLIKAVEFCRNLVLTSHSNNEGDVLDYEPFKFSPDSPSEFYIDFVTEGVEYEYSFSLYKGKVISEELYHYPKGRRSKVFVRSNTYSYDFKKGVIPRPGEVEVNTGPKTLFISRASSMNRDLAKTVYRFFMSQMVFGLDTIDLSRISPEQLGACKDTLLRGLAVSDSDIADIRLVEDAPGSYRLQSFHSENPQIAFDFLKEESEGTQRMLKILMLLLLNARQGATFFLDEFDLKLHFRLAEFVLDLIRASRTSQLVFTSHNPLLIDKETLRPEQIVFVNKQADGNSEFTPLVDFVGLGRNTDPRLAYLQGRFDAVPYVGAACEVMVEYGKS